MLRCRSIDSGDEPHDAPIAAQAPTLATEMKSHEVRIDQRATFSRIGRSPSNSTREGYRRPATRRVARMGQSAGSARGACISLQRRRRLGKQRHVASTKNGAQPMRSTR